VKPASQHAVLSLQLWAQEAVHVAAPGAGSNVVGGSVGADVEGMAGDGVATVGADVERSDVGGSCSPSTAQVQRP